MSDKKVINSNTLQQNTLEKQYIKSMQVLKEGQLLTGTIIQINSEHVFLDVGYKSEGKIPITEFKDPPKIGDQVNVVLIRKEGREGVVIVSKKQADEKILWKNLKIAFENKTPIEATIIKPIKGGFDVEIKKDIHGFLPLSKLDTNRFLDINMDDFIGMKSFFLIERLYSNGKINIILSRKAWLQTENIKKKKTFFDTVNIGDEVEGTVKSFASFGAFIDLDGFDGLLHINDMSWGHITSPKEIVDEGDKLKLKVIRLDKKTKRINLSLKHFTDDPWSSFEDRYRINDIVKGTVSKLTNFGAFIKIEDGIEGLVHISELSWVKKIKHPSEILKDIDEVEVMILDYDISKGKVSLGLKQANPNPWDDIKNRFPVGMRLKRNVKNLSNFGAFVELEEGIDGLIHLDDFSWTKNYKHPGDFLKQAQEIEVIVIHIDKKNKRIKLGIKQLTEDPWISISKAFPKGKIIEGKIKSITDSGTIVTVQGDIEGSINKNNLIDANAETLEEVLKKYKVGDSIKAIVMEINPSKQKLSLSRKHYLQNLNKNEIAKYIHDEKQKDTVSLGDMLKDKSSD